MELLLFNAFLPWNMSSLSETVKIEKLNGKNYPPWKYNIKLILMERGLSGFTQEGQETPPEETATAAVENAFRLRSDKAYSLIALNVEKGLQDQCKKKLTGLHDSYSSWHLYIRRFLFGLSTFL